MVVIGAALIILCLSEVRQDRFIVPSFVAELPPLMELVPPSTLPRG
jgi:hypothetical protein